MINFYLDSSAVDYSILVQKSAVRKNFQHDKEYLTTTPAFTTTTTTATTTTKIKKNYLGVKVKEETAASSQGSPSSPCSTSNLVGRCWKRKIR